MSGDPKKTAPWRNTSTGWSRTGRIGSRLGAFWYRFFPVRRGTVLANLSLALPHKKEHHDHIARAFFQQFCTGIVESIFLMRRAPEPLDDLVSFENIDLFHKARQQGRGVIVATAHFGNFDLLALAAAGAGAELGIVSKHLKNGRLNRLWMNWRERWGLTIFPDAHSGRALIRWLRSGKTLGIVIDQRTGPHRGGIAADFFGRPAWTTPLPARLARATGAPIIFATVERRSDGRHSVRLEPTSERDFDSEQYVAERTRELNQLLERRIEQRPDHWMWLHRRFKTGS